MAEQLDLADAPAAIPPAPDPWPAIRAANPGKQIARRIFVNALEQEWLVLEGELAEVHDGATMFVHAPPLDHASTPAEDADTIDQFNRLWHERLQREQRT